MASAPDQGLSIEEMIAAAVQAIRAAVPESMRHPQLAVVCGSGLARLESLVDPIDRVVLGFDQVPHLHRATGIHEHKQKAILD